MGLARQEYGSALSFPSPGDLPVPAIEPTSLAVAGEFFTTELQSALIPVIVRIDVNCRCPAGGKTPHI